MTPRTPSTGSGTTGQQPLVITMISRQQGITGVHTHVRQLAEHLSGQGHPPVVVTPHSWIRSRYSWRTAVLGAASLRADAASPRTTFDPAALPSGSRTASFAATGGLLGAWGSVPVRGYAKTRAPRTLVRGGRAPYPSGRLAAHGRS